MKNKLLLVLLLSIPVSVSADLVISAPCTYSLITFLKGVSVKWVSATALKTAATSPELLISGVEIISAGKTIIAGKIAAAGIEKSIEVGNRFKGSLEVIIEKSNKEQKSKEETIDTVQVGL